MSGYCNDCGSNRLTRDSFEEQAERAEARAEAAEAERDKLHAWAGQSVVGQNRLRAEVERLRTLAAQTDAECNAAEAGVERLTRERDEALALAEVRKKAEDRWRELFHSSVLSVEAHRAQLAEARRLLERAIERAELPHSPACPGPAVPKACFCWVRDARAFLELSTSPLTPAP